MTTTRRSDRWRLTAYLLGIGLTGLGLLVLVGTTATVHEVTQPGFISLALALTLIVGELEPIPVPRGGEVGDEISISSTIAIALLMLAHPIVALATQALALTLDEALERRAWRRLFFNIGQYTLSLMAARECYAALVGQSVLEPARTFATQQVLAAVAGGTVFCLLNHVLTSIAVSLKLRLRVWHCVVSDLRSHIFISLVILPMAPVIAIAVMQSVWTLPILLLPIIAVHRSARLAYEREYASLHDPLTGLGNRALFAARLGHACRELDQGPFAMALLDVDRFKDVNDTLGHGAGDRYLQELALRLRQAMRAGDLVARLGGDEFAVIAFGVDSMDDVQSLTSRLHQAVRPVVTIDGVQLEPSVTIGVSLAPVHGTTPDLLTQRADIAMYRAKGLRGSAEIYDEARDDTSVHKLTLLGEMRTAIETGAIKPHFQPKCEPATGRLLGMEALARWHHPTLGIVPPDEFIPLAETSGLISDLTRSIIAQSLDQLAEWNRAGWHLSVAVNVSARALAEHAFGANVAAELQRAGVRPEQLTLEITETVLITADQRIMSILDDIRRLGVRLSIDDFGTGYSSLAYLKHLSLDEIKIDRCFVTNMIRERQDAVLVRSAIDIAHQFGIAVVAEGVEDEETLQCLARLDCEGAQGFHLSRPMEGAAATAWLLSRAESENEFPVAEAI